MLLLDNYELLPTGAIKQINVKPFVYDPKYVAERYDAYGVLCDMMSYLRYGYIIASIQEIPNSVLDVGYGNGSFLKICKEAGIRTYGADVSDYPLLHGEVIRLNDFDLSQHFKLVTFFDSLEHFQNIDFLSKLNCDYIVISVPHCHYNWILSQDGADAAQEYFKNWKHRRPDEHIWHFDLSSLNKTMEDCGYTHMISSSVEDIIRKPVNSYGYPNILTSIFKKRK